MKEEPRSKAAEPYKSRGRKLYTPKKQVNYVPRGGKAFTPVNPQPEDESLSSKEVRRLYETRKRELLSSYSKRTEGTLLESWVKTIKDIYSEESLDPEASKPFALPMERSIMPPRKTRPPQAREVRGPKDRQGGYDDRPEQDPLEDDAQDQGMIVGTSEKAAPVHSAPLWFNGEGPSRSSDARDSSPTFSLEDLEQRQNKLEEEKAKYLGTAPKLSGPLQARPTETSREAIVKLAPSSRPGASAEGKAAEKKTWREAATPELEQDYRYSHVDELFEEKLKTNSVEEIFAQASAFPSADKAESLNAITLKDLEANMLERSKAESKKEPLRDEHEQRADEQQDLRQEQEDSGTEEGEPAPQWDQFSAEEIKKQTREHPDAWHSPLFSESKSALSSLTASTVPCVPAPMTMPPSEQDMASGITRMSLDDKSLPEPATFAFIDPGTESLIESERALSPERMREPRVDPAFELGLGESQGPANPFVLSPLGVKDDDRVWFYKDLQGLVQGPFTSHEMHMWHNSGYFPPNLPLRCGDTSMFVPLELYLQSSLQQRSELFSGQPYNPDPRYNYPQPFGYSADRQSSFYTVYHVASLSQVTYPRAYGVSYPIPGVPAPQNPRTRLNMPMQQPRGGMIPTAYPMLRVASRMQYFPQPAFRTSTYVYGTSPPIEADQEGNMRADPRGYSGPDMQDPRLRPSLS